MRSEYIKEEVKKGNNVADAKIKAPKIDMIPPPSIEEAMNKIDRKRDRSRSKSKSPGPEARNNY